MLNKFKKSLLKAINVSSRHITEEEIDKLLNKKVSTKRLENKIYLYLKDITAAGSMYSNPRRISIAREINLLMFIYSELKIDNDKIKYILYLLNSIANWEDPVGSMKGKERFIKLETFIQVGNVIETETSDDNEKLDIKIESREGLFNFNVERFFEDGVKDSIENVSFDELSKMIK